MKLEVSILAGRVELRQAMNTTQNNWLKSNCKPLSDKGARKAFLQRHGSLDAVIFKVRAIVPERVHAHLRTHHLTNQFYYCSTSRPDLTDDDGKYRMIMFYLPAKRLLDIAEVRVCNGSWNRTQYFMDELIKEVINLEPELEGLLQPSCVVHGYCREFKDCIDYKERYEKYKSNYKGK